MRQVGSGGAAMTGPGQAEERIALLQARGQGQRLAAQLALLEAREQLAPLRSAAGTVAAAARLFSPGSSIGEGLRSLVRVGLGRPQLVLPVATLAWGLLRRRPFAVAIAAAAGTLAWWLFRGPAGEGSRPAEPRP
jgi:hypothetical protein